MSNFADFAAVAEITQSAVQQTLRIYHSARVLPVSLNDSRVIPNPVGPGNATVQYALFMDMPVVTLAAAFDPYIAFDLRFFGQVSANGAIVGNQSREMMLNTRILFRPTIIVANGGAQVRVNLVDVNVAAVNITALSGGPIPAILTAFIQSAAARNAFTQILRGSLAGINSLLPPLFNPLLNQLGVNNLVVITRFVHKVMDGALAIGMDIGQLNFSLNTMGDPSQIVNFLSISDLAMCVHPGIAALITAMARPKVDQAAAKEGAVVDKFSMSLESENFFVSGHAKKDDFGASFSMRAKPKLGKPEKVIQYDDEYGGQYTEVFPGTDDIWIDVYDVNLSAELPWWVYLGVTGAVLLLPMLAPVTLLGVVSIIEGIRQNIIYQLEVGAESGAGTSRVQRITLPGTNQPFVDLTVSQLKVGTSGLQSRLWFSPVYGYTGQIKGDTTTSLERVFSAPFNYELTPSPNLYHPDDPQVRIRWEVRRLDTNAVIFIQERRLTDQNATRIQLDLSQGDLSKSEYFSISCRAYRNLAGTVEDLVNQSVKLRIYDRLDRHHPFVRWDHAVFVPQVKVHQDGTREILAYHVKKRKSAIHRTDYPGRCLFVDDYSAKVEPRPERNWPGALVYLDSLPFPFEELNSHRSQVCDYCFYGGPDKTIPKLTE